MAARWHEAGKKPEGMRKRADGTWTFTTEEWDARYYWPEGTRVRFRGMGGIVMKENSTTSWVQFENGQYLKVAHSALERA